MIVIIDYGLGNVGSVLNMLKRLGVDACISASIEEMEKADKLILPGVGSFDYGMTQLNERGLIAPLNKKVLEQATPILGICLGMQLMSKSSEEGKKDGLGWFDVPTQKFDLKGINPELKIPHMGWNDVNPVRDHRLFRGIEDPRFYFVHSYHVMAAEKDQLATTRYGYDFVSSMGKDHIAAVQFHPEKSHKYGLQLLKNFVDHY